MDESSVELLTGVTIFLLGGGTGAALRYLRDRQLLRLYRDLNQQLARSLQLEREQSQAAVKSATQPAAVRAAAEAEVAPLAEAAKARIQRPRAS